jgi:3-methyladenine DNA glycosylase AlkD
MSAAVTAIRKELYALACPATAALQQRYFKTGPQQYGAGDVFLGIKVPPLRALAKRHRLADLGTIGDLLSRYHEERLLALLLLIRFYEYGSGEDRAAAYDLYLNNTEHINNWDLVDVSAPRIVGRHLQERSRAILHRLSHSSSLWEKRIVIISTLHFIRMNDFNDTLRIAKTLLGDDHDLLHKAVGWMLREVGKRDPAVEEDFLQQHYRDMPRTMLRYAIERFPETKRKSYLSGMA